MKAIRFSDMTIENFEKLCSDKTISFTCENGIEYDEATLFWTEYHIEQALRGGVV